jgi:hypothetical protein
MLPRLANLAISIVMIAIYATCPGLLQSAQSLNGKIVIGFYTNVNCEGKKELKKQSSVNSSRGS